MQMSCVADDLLCYWCTAKTPKKKAVWCPLDQDYQPTYHTYWSNIVVKDYRVGDSVYIVDYPFCSFECCLAYITENSWNYRYVKSRRLLMDIFRKSAGSDVPEPCPASHRSRLSFFGGTVKLSTFRKFFKKHVYEIERAVAIRPAQLEYGSVGRVSNDDAKSVLNKSSIVQRGLRVACGEFRVTTTTAPEDRPAQPASSLI